LRPFRGLRYDLARVGGLGDVLCPPYDVIDPSAAARLRSRHDRNAVRLELPTDVDGGGGGEDRYGHAAAELRRWRADGTLRLDPQPTVTAHEMRWRDATGAERVARGVLCRLALEPLAADGGVRPHERTMEGPKEDRFRLLAATGTDLSPVVLLAEADDAASALDAMTGAEPDADVVDEAGVRHRTWIVPVYADERQGAGGTEVLDALGAHPLTIADGHHRYETALRYHQDCGAARRAAGLPPADTVLVLVYPLDEAPSVLPTHRVVREWPGEAPPLDAISGSGLFEVDLRVTVADELVEWHATAPPGEGRMACWTREGGATLRARAERLLGDDDPVVPEVARRLDTALLATALERLAGIDATALRSGQRLRYVKDAREAVAMVDRGHGDVAFLLAPTPPEAVLRVAEAGGVMPQKSTYFHPKAPTGIVFDPLEG
jgi:uncharacterized protein (DUF1015 family)